MLLYKYGFLLNKMKYFLMVDYRMKLATQLVVVLFTLFLPYITTNGKLKSKD